MPIEKELKDENLEQVCGGGYADMGQTTVNDGACGYEVTLDLQGNCTSKVPGTIACAKCRYNTFRLQQTRS